MTKKWLVISNCQTVGLGNCLSLLCPNTDIEVCDIWRFRNEKDEWQAKLSSYDHLIVSPEVQKLGLVDFQSYANLTWVPNFFFRGFHPDLCYVYHPNGIVKGPLDDYHSVIVLAAYKSKLSVTATIQLFRHNIYEKLGFYDIWAHEKNIFINTFNDVDLDINRNFLKLVRHGCFMNSINHPKIEAVYSVAESIALKILGHHHGSNIRPHDNLANGAIYPLYPEIGEYLGMDGGEYLFKPAGSYNLINLEEFVTQSYLSYTNYDSEGLHPSYDTNQHYHKALTLIKEGV
jgi:hypothetical protein